MDKILEQSLLYDFYGELLTEHQKVLFEQVVLEDMSLSEAAEEAGISRQGVHDNVKRTIKTLEDYEDKLHLVERFMKIKDNVGRISEILGSARVVDDEAADKIRHMLAGIIEEL